MRVSVGGENRLTTSEPVQLLGSGFPKLASNQRIFTSQALFGACRTKAREYCVPTRDDRMAPNGSPLIVACSLLGSRNACERGFKVRPHSLAKRREDHACANEQFPPSSRSSALMPLLSDGCETLHCLAARVKLRSLHSAAKYRT
jgi:hypothetical protein